MIDQLAALGLPLPTLVAAAWLGLASLVGFVSGWLFLRGSPWPTRMLAAVGVASLLGSSTLLFTPTLADAELVPLPERVRNEGYASSDTCRACHPGQYESWHDSYHRTMTQVATPEAVAAPFDGSVLTERGRSFQLASREGGFYVAERETPEPALMDEAFWASARRVVMTTGSHNMQAYWVEGDDGNLEQVPFVFLIRDQRWLANSDSFLEPPHADDAPLVRYTWSDSCVTCHSTGGPWDAMPTNQDETPEATVAELGISCEACHGPGQAHVAANRSPARRYLVRTKDTGDPTIVNPARLDAARSASVCGRCHSVHPDGQGERVHDFRPGERLDEYLSIEPMMQMTDEAHGIENVEWLPFDDQDTVGSFWRDGSTRVAGREHSGIVRSGCYRSGEMSCLSCHSMHDSDPSKQLSLDAFDDAMCTECHETIALDVGGHTHHPDESIGSRCVNCHMPYTAYALLMATRTHTTNGPSATGLEGRERPNACNLCHLDQSLGWTAVYLSRWYAQRMPTTAERMDTLPAAVHWMLRGDASQRAIAAWHMGWGPTQQTAELEPFLPVLQTLLEDPYAAVRQVAATALRDVAPEAELDFVALTHDPIPHAPLRPEWEALLEQRNDMNMAIPE